MKSIKKYCHFILAIFLLSSAIASARVSLPKLISDGMVLQRNVELNVWGWAGANENISVRFKDSVYQVIANKEGEWTVTMPKKKAGGPFTMAINGSNSITIRDIYIGDVWICSGQSNMELPVSRVRPIYEKEITSSDNPEIRCFTVPQNYNFKVPQKDVEYGSWIAANPENVLNFSAVSYFFANEIYKETQVPIGLINASLGGSPAQAWMSEEAMKQFPHYYEEAQRFKNDSLIKQIQKEDRERSRSWHSILHQKDAGYKNPKAKWYAPDLNASDWKKMIIPSYWDEAGANAENGVVWFRKEIVIPPSMAGLPAKLNLGRIVDADSVYLNGFFVGTTSYQYPPRRYDVPADILKEGKNIIVIRVINNTGKGGFILDKPYELIAGGETIDLKGEWGYKRGASMEPLASQTFIRWKPLGLFNAMIAPLLNYNIKGVIWYQGESNTGKPLEYRDLFPAMIGDWRTHWNQGEFPFLFVQLANFMEAQEQPSSSNWALLRESQLKSLSVPNTGMAVTIDIGEWNDIHPLNKKDVGKRLAKAAQKVAYDNDDIVYSGPVYNSMKIKDDQIILNFKHTGSGLEVKGNGKLKGFSIAGEDRRFFWADAKIVDGKVVVSSEDVENPETVRYAWADNPEGANLFNKEGLPASPFRTDSWPSQNADL